MSSVDITENSDHIVLQSNSNVIFIVGENSTQEEVEELLDSVLKMDKTIRAIAISADSPVTIIRFNK